MAEAFTAREAMPGDMWLMLPDVRRPDVDELAALGVTPETAIRYGVEHSVAAWIAFIHGKPAAMFGIVDHADYGVPWAVLTNVVDEHPLPFLRASKRFIDAQMTRDLINYVDARNTLTIDWLSWLGFTVDPPVPAGINGEPFARFWSCARPG